MDSSDIVDLITENLNQTSDHRVAKATTQIGEDGVEVKLITWDENDNRQVWIINVEEYIAAPQEDEN